MIDLNTETVLSLADAAKVLPKRRAGKPTHVATVYRWAQRGCRGVVLETIRVGCTRCTSREALQRFCEALTRGDGRRRSSTAKQRKQRADRAERELAKALS